MGKSTAASMLAKLGCGVHSADEAVREALSPKGAAFEEVAVTFPACWDKKKHLIKRDMLADIIFNDASKRKQLEDILHPVVRQSQKKFIQNQERLGREIVVLDIPLLFETGAEERVDYTLVVSAPYHVQRHRVLDRPGMTEEKFSAILKTQMPDAEKRARADFVIPTGMGMAYTYKSLEQCLKGIK
jgi:dephospho-CoA kinase